MDKYFESAKKNSSFRRWHGQLDSLFPGRAQEWCERRKDKLLHSLKIPEQITLGTFRDLYEIYIEAASLNKKIDIEFIDFLISPPPHVWSGMFFWDKSLVDPRNLPSSPKPVVQGNLPTALDLIRKSWQQDCWPGKRGGSFKKVGPSIIAHVLAIHFLKTTGKEHLSLVGHLLVCCFPEYMNKRLSKRSNKDDGSALEPYDARRFYGVVKDLRRENIQFKKYYSKIFKTYLSQKSLKNKIKSASPL